MNNEQMQLMFTEAARFLRTVNPNGHLLELRVATQGGMWSGRFDDMKEMARVAVILQMFRGARAVYYSLNPLRPEATHVGSKELNKVLGEARKGRSAKDKDIAYREVYLIDCDPVHPSDTMASDAQCAEALSLANQVRDYLTGLGWPEPIVVSSGNGTHLLYRGDACIPASESWHQVLRHLAKKFNTAEAKIDTSVSNPARISRLPGCNNTKGGGSRMARVLSYPATWEPVAHGPLVSGLANDTGTKTKSIGKNSSKHRTSKDKLRELLADEDDVLQIISEFPEHLHLSHVDQRDDGRTYFILDECPFVGRSHEGDPNKSALILGDKSLGYKCWAGACDGRGWSDLRRHLFELTGRFPSVRVYNGQAPDEVSDEEAQCWGFADAQEMFDLSVPDAGDGRGRAPALLASDTLGLPLRQICPRRS